MLYRIGCVVAAIAVAVCVATGGGCQRGAEKRTTPYVIAYPSNWNHIQLYGTEQRLIGFSSDLLYEIARTVNVPIRLVMADQDSFPSLLDSGQVDGILTALPVNVETDQFYEFSVPYFVNGTVIVVAANSTIVRSDELKGAIIGYNYNSGVESTLGIRNLGPLQSYESIAQGLDAVISGNIDGMILNYINASRLKRSFYRSKIRILSPPLSTENVRLAVRRGKNHALITLFNQGVVKYVKSGQYKELLDYWGVDSLPLPTNILP